MDRRFNDKLNILDPKLQLACTVLLNSKYMKANIFLKENWLFI